MSGHTPGPWLAEHREGDDGMYRTEVFSEEHGNIATCDWTPKHCGNGVTETYREDNARLIAAAPDLLTACELLIASKRSGKCSDRLAAVDAARAAIARATGEAA